MRARVPLGIALLAALSAGAASSTEVPVAVSPGHASKVALVEGRCPTFSWGVVAEAKSYELVVYQLGAESEEAPVVRKTFRGLVNGWTPSLDSCFERGGRYAWSVRAVDDEASSKWSLPSLFEVASGPGEVEFEAALEVVRSYLAERRVPTPAQGAERVSASDPRAASGAGLGGAPQSVAVGDSALRVNGAAVVTTATLGVSVAAQLCEAVDYRFVDQGDGSVLDCNTGFIWLKNASCAELSGTDGLGRASWAAAEAAAAALSHGTCGLTDGSEAGQWRQPEIIDLCDAWSGSALSPCPPSAAAMSLIDSTVSPTVVDASGTAVWTEGDAFVGVQPSLYWTSNDHPSGNACVGDLDSGDVNCFSPKESLLYIWPVRGP